MEALRKSPHLTLVVVTYEPPPLPAVITWQETARCTTRAASCSDVESPDAYQQIHTQRLCLPSVRHTQSAHP